MNYNIHRATQDDVPWAAFISLVEYCNKQSSNQYSETIHWNDIWASQVSADKD